MNNESRLELAPEQMRRLGYRVVDLLVEHFTNLRHKPVGAKALPQQLHGLLHHPPSNEPSDPHQLLDFLDREIFPNCLHVDHPRFFAFVPSPNNFVSAMSDALASGLNIFNGTWLGGSGAAALEATVIDWLRGFCGLPETGGGILVSGGSVANLTALTAARHAILNDRTEGAVVYLSDQTHSSVDRALAVIGFKPDQIRHLESDSHFRLPVEALQQAIQQDRNAGLRPFCVIANAGTTNTGAVDPLNELADICATEKLWFHIDGAYGAAAVICDQGRQLLHGLERADSLSLDPHKWLFQSFECGCVLLRDARQLKATFLVMPEYLRDVRKGDEEIHPCDYGIQLTRGFRALKVWLSLNTFGMNAYRLAVARGFALAEFAEQELRAMPDCQVVTSAQMGIVCFRFAEGDAAQSYVIDQMLQEGYAFLTSTRLRGEACLRLCTINPRTSEQDISETIRRVATFARHFQLRT